MRRLLPVAALIGIALVAYLAALRPTGVVVRPKREMPSDAVFFYQEDAAWSGDAMGDSGRTLGKDGDGVACLASLIAMQRMPVNGTLNPGTLNAWLCANGGYDAKGNLRWKEIAARLGVKLMQKRAGSGVSQLLDELLQQEVYAIAQVRRPDTGRFHEVLIAGSVHGEYTIVDPLDPTGTLNTLGLYGNRIYAVRYLQ